MAFLSALFFPSMYSRFAKKPVFFSFFHENSRFSPLFSCFFYVFFGFASFFFKKMVHN